MKTKEQQAEERANKLAPVIVAGTIISNTIEDLNENCRADFIAGYEAMQQWIPVEENLPPKSKNLNFSDDVFVTDGHAKAVGYYYHEKEEWRINNNFDFEVTHWLPIPKLP